MVVCLQSTPNGGGTSTKFAVPGSVSRLNYFLGQLLNQRDLQTEQSYHLLLQRLMQREVFGTGTVAGLEVAKDVDGTTLPLGVFIRAGLAIDPDGRELILEKDVCVDVADPPLSPSTTTPLSSTDRGVLASEIQALFQESFVRPGANPAAELDLLVDALVRCGLLTQQQATQYLTDATVVRDLLNQITPTPPQLTPPQVLRDFLFDQLVGVTSVGLRYREAGAEPTPALLDAACCGDTTCQPARIQESVFVVTSRMPFPSTADPFESIKLCLDENFFVQMENNSSLDNVDCKLAVCQCLFQPSAWRGLPRLTNPCASEDLPVVCLATVCWSRFTLTSATSQILNIDNCECRPLAPGGPVLRAITESLTGCKAPQALLPRFEAVTPADGAVLNTGPAELSVTADAALAATGGTPATWEILFYADGNTNVESFSGDTSASATGPGGSTVQMAIADDGSGRHRQVVLTITGASGFPAGTYVWRIPNSSPTLMATANNAVLDGEPNPPNAVPSGDSQPGGAFEARFVVTGG